MAKEEIKDGKGKLMGSTEDRGKEILAFDKNGRPKARYDKQQNMTFDASGAEIGKGNLLMRLFQQSQEQSQVAKSSYTGRGAAQKPTVGIKKPPIR